MSMIEDLPGVDKQQIVDITQLQALPRNVEAAQGRALGRDRLIQGDRLGAQGAQHIRNVLERSDDYAAILRHRLIECGTRMRGR